MTFHFFLLISFIFLIINLYFNTFSGVLLQLVNSTQLSLCLEFHYQHYLLDILDNTQPTLLQDKSYQTIFHTFDKDQLPLI